MFTPFTDLYPWQRWWFKRKFDTEQHIIVLTKAREMIESGEQFYVCHALSACGGSAAFDLTRHISRVQKVSTIRGWFRRKTGHFLSYSSQRILRIKWLDEMIDYLEK